MEHPTDLTFGEAMDRLDAVVNQLEESEELGLEQALALYEQGTVLASLCQQRLAAAQLRLTEISITPANHVADGRAE